MIEKNGMILVIEVHSEVEPLQQDHEYLHYFQQIQEIPESLVVMLNQRDGVDVKEIEIGMLYSALEALSNKNNSI